MDLAGIPIFQAMQEKLKYHSARQAVLAQNVANLDTPDYRAQDMTAPNFSAMLTRHNSAASLKVTNANHIKSGSGSGGGNTVERENTYELNPIGNNVSVEEEMMRVAENQSEYQKVLGIYRKSLDMFKIALGKPSGG